MFPSHVVHWWPEGCFAGQSLSIIIIIVIIIIIITIITAIAIIIIVIAISIIVIAIYYYYCCCRTVSKASKRCGGAGGTQEEQPDFPPFPWPRGVPVRPRPRAGASGLRGPARPELLLPSSALSWKRLGAPPRAPPGCRAPAWNNREVSESQILPEAP